MTGIACLHVVLVLTLLTLSKNMYLLNWIRKLLMIVLIWNSRLYMAIHLPTQAIDVMSLTLIALVNLVNVIHCAWQCANKNVFNWRLKLPSSRIGSRRWSDKIFPDRRGCDADSTSAHAPWTVCGVAQSVHLVRQIASVSEKLHQQLMYTIQKDTRYYR